jgi:hypothetical protein
VQQRLPQSSRWPSRQGAQIGPTAGRGTVASTEPVLHLSDVPDIEPLLPERDLRKGRIT